MIWEGDMDFWEPAEHPEVMIVGPAWCGGTTIMTEGFSKGRQNHILPDLNQVITIITTLQRTSFSKTYFLFLFDVAYIRPVAS